MCQLPMCSMFDCSKKKKHVDGRPVPVHSCTFSSAILLVKAYHPKGICKDKDIKRKPFQDQVVSNRRKIWYACLFIVLKILSLSVDLSFNMFHTYPFHCPFKSLVYFVILHSCSTIYFEDIIVALKRLAGKRQTSETSRPGKAWVPGSRKKHPMFAPR